MISEADLDLLRVVDSVDDIVQCCSDAAAAVAGRPLPPGA
jgi:hypothetical protein